VFRGERLSLELPHNPSFSTQNFLEREVCGVTTIRAGHYILAAGVNAFQ
jgi:hypothetical protein